VDGRPLFAGFRRDPFHHGICLVVSAAVLMPFLPLISSNGRRIEGSRRKPANSGRPSTPQALRDGPLAELLPTLG